MPSRTPKAKRKAPTRQKKIAQKSRKVSGQIKQDRFAETGIKTRVAAHGSSRGKRNQAKRDAR